MKKIYIGAFLFISSLVHCDMNNSFLENKVHELRNSRPNISVSIARSKTNVIHNHMMGALGVSNTCATAEERITMLCGFYQNEILRRHHHLDKPDIVIGKTDSLSLQRHKFTCLLMREAASLFVDNPLMMLNTPGLLSYLKENIALYQEHHRLFFTLPIFNIIFPQGFFKKMADYANNFKDYQYQVRIKLALELHKDQPHDPILLYANQSPNMYDQSAYKHVFDFFNIQGNDLTLSIDGIRKLGAAHMGAQHAFENMSYKAVENHVRSLNKINCNTFIVEKIEKFMTLLEICPIDPRFLPYKTSYMEQLMKEIAEELAYPTSEPSQNDPRRSEGVQSTLNESQLFINCLGQIGDNIENDFYEFLMLINFLDAFHYSSDSWAHLKDFYNSQRNDQGKVIYSLRWYDFHHVKIQSYLPTWDFVNNTIKFCTKPFYKFITDLSFVDNFREIFSGYTFFDWAWGIYIQIACQKAFFNHPDNREKYIFPAMDPVEFSLSLNKDNQTYRNPCIYTTRDEDNTINTTYFEKYSPLLNKLFAKMYIKYIYGDEDDEF